MGLLLPALALVGVFGVLFVDRERKQQGKAPGRIEGPLPGWSGPHSHEALLPMPDPKNPGVTLWVTPHHPLWCRAVGYHMRLCVEAAKRLATGPVPPGLVPGFEAVQLAHARIDEARANGRRPPPTQLVAAFDGTPGAAARLYREGRLG